MRQSEEESNIEDICASYFFTFNPTKTFIDNHKKDLFQQFFIISVDFDDLSKLYSYEGNSMKEFIFKEHIRPKVISKYPPFDLDYIKIPDQVVAFHSCPNFYQLIPETNKMNLNTEKYYFSLDNLSPVYMKVENQRRSSQLFKKYSEIYNKVYYDCYLFYEPLSAYDLYFKKNSKNKNIRICKILCLSSFLPFQREKISILKKIRKMSQVAGLTVPLEKIVERIINDIPSIPKGFHFLYDFFKLRKFQYEFIRSPPNKLPKCSLDMQILISYFTPDLLMKVFKAILLELPLMFFNKNKEILSSIIEIFLVLLYPFEYKNTVVHILPKDNYSLIHKLNSFIIGIEDNYSEDFLERNNINILHKHILLVNLQDNKKTNLIFHKPNINEPILSMNYNNDRNKSFEYIVDENIFETVDMPVHYTNKALDELKKEFESFQKEKNKSKDNPQIRMPSISNVKLEEEMEYIGYDVVSDTNNFNSNIQSIFYYFFVSVFLEIRNYFNINEEQIEEGEAPPFKKLTNLNNLNDIEDIFNIKKYFKDLPLLDVPFYERFCKSEMFKEFIINKRFPISYDHIDKILLFEENIIKKLNKKAFSKKTKIYFSSEEFSLKDLFDKTDKKTVIQYDSDLFEFSTEELDALKDLKKNREEYKKLCQRYSFIKDKDNSLKDKMIFLYTVFPKFITNEMLSPIISKENNFYNFRISSDSENKDKVVKKIKKYETMYYNFCYSLKDKISSYYYLETGNIYNVFSFESLVSLLWFKLFIKEFKNVKESEKDNIFKQLIFIIKNSKWVPENILGSIFYCLYKYGTYEELISLFNFIQPNHYKYNILLANKCLEEKSENEGKLKERILNLRQSNTSPELEFTFNFLDIIYCPGCNDKIKLQSPIHKNFKNSKYFCNSCHINYFGTALLVVKRKEQEQEVMNIAFQILPLIDLIEEIDSNEDFYDLFPLTMQRSKIFSCIFYFSYCGLPSKFIVHARDLFKAPDIYISNQDKFEIKGKEENKEKSKKKKKENIQIESIKEEIKEESNENNSGEDLSEEEDVIVIQGNKDKKIFEETPDNFEVRQRQNILRKKSTIKAMMYMSMKTSMSDNPPDDILED
ncbi:MAG: hypothetical protein MJ252_06255 [archaeon]|nr:hypothetical protein [archaeon]